MTIDERLEALTQTVELMAHMHVETDKRLSAAIASVSEAHAKTEKTVDRMAETIRRMGRYAMVIARDHEGRLAALESEEADLDE
jgi:hypothetical protein